MKFSLSEVQINNKEQFNEILNIVRSLNNVSDDIIRIKIQEFSLFYNCNVFTINKNANDALDLLNRFALIVFPNSEYIKMFIDNLPRVVNYKNQYSINDKSLDRLEKHIKSIKKSIDYQLTDNDLRLIDGIKSITETKNEYLLKLNSYSSFVFTKQTCKMLTPLVSASIINRNSNYEYLMKYIFSHKVSQLIITKDLELEN